MGYDNGDLPFKGGASCVSLDTELLPSYSPVTSQKYEQVRDIQKWWRGVYFNTPPPISSFLSESNERTMCSGNSVRCGGQQIKYRLRKYGFKAILLQHLPVAYGQ